MAKRAKGTTRKAWVPMGQFVEFTGLAADAVENEIVQGSNAAGSDYILRSVKLNYAVANAAADEGPFIAVIAHGDYTDAEVAECLNVITGFDPGNKIEQERMKRLVRRIGLFGASDGVEDITINDGLPLTTKLNWHIQGSVGFRIGIWNRSEAAVTGSPVLEFDGTAYINWV